MTLKKDLKNRLNFYHKLYLILGSIFFTFLAIEFSYFGVLEKIDQQISDNIYQMINYRRAETSVQIISIDDNTVRHLGNYEDWSRSQTAKLIRTLNNSDNAPAVIGIDLDYSKESDSVGDESLIDACKTYGNVCLSASVTMEELKKTRKKIFDLEIDFDTDDNTAVSASDISLPFDGLLPYITTGVINNTRTSQDGIARNAFASIPVDGTEYDSFAVATYKMYMDRLGRSYSLPKVDEDNTFAFTYTKQSKDYNVTSFYDVITGKADLSIFKGNIVYVGNYAKQKTAFSAPDEGQMQPIEVQANILEALLTQRTGHMISHGFMAVFYAAFAVIFFIATSYSSSLKTFLSALILLIAQVLFCGFLYTIGYYILILIPIGLVVLITIFNLFVRYFITRYEQKKMVSVFKQYVDENVVNEIVQNGTEAKIGTAKKDIAVLFVDIRGFTSLSESLEPEKIVEILNKYLTLTTEAVSKNNGTLDKFIGDAAMAVFNSPSDLEDYEYKAVNAAWDLLSSAQELNAFCLEQYGKEVAFGIGIHCGEAVIGNIGCKSRMDYTAIGDTVNTASRLEGVAQPGQILISETMHQRLIGRIKTSFAGEFALKGKKNSTPAYAVEGIYVKFQEPEPESQKEPLRFPLLKRSMEPQETR